MHDDTTETIKEKHPGGRPLKFPDVEALEALIQAHFDECVSKTYTDANGVKHLEPLTITGLALALGTTRKTLLDYEEKGEFSYTIKQAKTVVENYAEKRLFGTSPTGAIFALKNYGWKDKTESEITGANGDPLSMVINDCRNRTAGLPSEDK